MGEVVSMSEKRPPVSIDVRFAGASIDASDEQEVASFRKVVAYVIKRERNRRAMSCENLAAYADVEFNRLRAIEKAKAIITENEVQRIVEALCIERRSFNTSVLLRMDGEKRKRHTSSQSGNSISDSPLDFIYENNLSSEPDNNVRLIVKAAGNTLYIKRTWRELSIGDLADEAQMDPSHLQEMEDGKRKIDWGNSKLFEVLGTNAQRFKADVGIQICALEIEEDNQLTEEE